jgi:hypothetical protein
MQKSLKQLINLNHDSWWRAKQVGEFLKIKNIRDNLRQIPDDLRL